MILVLSNSSLHMTDTQPKVAETKRKWWLFHLGSQGGSGSKPCFMHAGSETKWPTLCLSLHLSQFLFILKGYHHMANKRAT